MTLPRLLITGARGFLGSHLLQHLRQQSPPLFDVHVHTGRQQSDLCQPEALDALPAVDMVVHLAGASGPWYFEQHAAQSWQQNLTATLNLLNWAAVNKVKHFVLASTYVYGTPRFLPVNEEHPVQPQHAYACSKYLCEQLLQQFVRDTGMRGTALRIFNVYGSGQGTHMLIPTILRQLTKSAMTLRDALPRRDFLHVDDLSRAFIASLQLPAASVFEAINLASGQSISVAELVDLITELAGVAPEICYLQQSRASEVLDVVGDISKARRLLQWRPRISMQQGLQDLVQAVVS
ncbi:MAG: NAD(P)-dependent oxidoreductase [Candidatus Sericytochromatia bacterium]|nr:NAD(P)-dependent oxidoreductase [Candidatus Sericytochromatia bacterium]